MKLWLDDLRPAPAGWTHIKTAEEAKKILAQGCVEEASLDHDLGLRHYECQPCRYVSTCDRDVCECTCHDLLDGTDLVRWMAETGHWPKTKPTVHSMNVVGRAYMNGVIDRYFK